MRRSRTPDHTRFDWGAAGHATIHGFTLLQIEDAFNDPSGLYITPPKRNRSGKRRADDGRRELLAQVKPNGPLLHIAYTVVGGRIRPFHCREMNAQERRRYRQP